MPVGFDVTNQKASPALYASSLATRPAASFVGRLFVDTDTPSTGIYRDTGTVWLSISGGSSETQSLNDVCVIGNSTTALGILIYGQSAVGTYDAGVQINPEGNYALTIGEKSDSTGKSLYTANNNLFGNSAANTIIEGKVRIGDTSTPTVALEVAGDVALGLFGTSNIKFLGNNAQFDWFGSNAGNYAKFDNGDSHDFKVGINVTPTVALDVVGDVKITSLQDFATNAAAITGNLVVGQLFYTNIGGEATVKIVI